MKQTQLHDSKGWVEEKTESVHRGCVDRRPEQSFLALPLIGPVIKISSSTGINDSPAGHEHGHKFFSVIPAACRPDGWAGLSPAQSDTRAHLLGCLYWAEDSCARQSPKRLLLSPAGTKRTYFVCPLLLNTKHFTRKHPGLAEVGHTGPHWRSTRSGLKDSRMWGCGLHHSSLGSTGDNILGWWDSRNVFILQNAQT